KTPTGKLANPFPIGPAILWMPFFVVAHGVAAIARPAHWRDGTSSVHQLITLYGSFLYAFAAMLLAYALARRRVGAGAAMTAAVGGEGGRALLRRRWEPMVGAACAFVVFLPQVIAWHVIFGTWFGIPQGAGYMQWAHPLWAETLFSSRNGLFPYAPLWAVGML